MQIVRRVNLVLCVENLGSEQILFETNIGIMHCSIISIFLALLSLGWCLPLPNWSAMQEQNYLHCTATLMSQLTLIQTATDSMGKVWLFGGSGSYNNDIRTFTRKIHFLYRIPFSLTNLFLNCLPLIYRV